MKHQYFTHINTDCLYRFLPKNSTNGQAFLNDIWIGGMTERLYPRNWTRVSRDAARHAYPKAFRKNKALTVN